jgi:hypothetical protein
MKSLNRDLLVLSKKESVDKRELELEVEKLHAILFHAEAMDKFCIANEIIDINNYKVINDSAKIEKLIKQSKLKPFVFINNKN